MSARKKKGPETVEEVLKSVEERLQLHVAEEGADEPQVPKLDAGSLWIEGLLRFVPSRRNRLTQGRVHARDGRVLNLAVAPGAITASVADSRVKPHAVTLKVRPFDDAVWNRVTASLASKTHLVEPVLAGILPEGIDAVFEKQGVSLLPSSIASVVGICSCPAFASATFDCEHISAVNVAFAETLEQNPQLLFTVRGREPARVALDLRKARGEAAPPKAAKAAKPSSAQAPHGRPMDVKSPEVYFTWRMPPPKVVPDLDGPVSFTLAELGSPVGWRLPHEPEELLRPFVKVASRRALETLRRSKG